MGWLLVEATPEAADDALLAHLREPVGVYQWHLDVFDLPEGAVRLARSAQSEHQAFRYGERVWGLQFHPEVDLPLYLGWIQNYKDAPARMGLDPAALEAAVEAGSPQFTEPLFGGLLLGLRGRRELERVSETRSQLRGSRSWPYSSCQPLRDCCPRHDGGRARPPVQVRVLRRSPCQDLLV